MNDDEYRLDIAYRSRIGTAVFDSRAFSIPKEEVCNYFLWRQQDSYRNALQMLAQSKFSQKQLQNKNCDEIQEMLLREKQVHFDYLPWYLKRGACVVKEHYDKDGVMRSKWVVDEYIPVFSQNREYIEKHLLSKEEQEELVTVVE